jgi:hypothetical protein
MITFRAFLIEKVLPPNFPSVDKIHNQSIQEMIRGNRWNLKVEPQESRFSYPGEQFTIHIHPHKISDQIKEVPHRYGGSEYYDSEIATHSVKDDRGYTFNHYDLKPHSGYKKMEEFPDYTDEQHLIRGISHEEFENIKKTGYIQSNNSYNLGELQNGLTYFTKRFGTARSYASGFAPYHLQATFGKPAYIIKIKHPEKQDIDTSSAPEGEFGVRNKIPASNIQEIHELRAVAIKPGFVEIHRHGWGSDAVYKEGSRSSPSVRLAMKKIL